MILEYQNVYINGVTSKTINRDLIALLNIIVNIGGSSIGAQRARAPPFWRATHANYIATREAHILGLSTVE